MHKAHKFIHIQGSGSLVSSSIYGKGIESHLYGPRSGVSGPMSHHQSWVSGPTFGIYRFIYPSQLN